MTEEERGAQEAAAKTAAEAANNANNEEPKYCRLFEESEKKRQATEGQLEDVVLLLFSVSASIR